jgi:uncharacterized membrane protein YhhN
VPLRPLSLAVLVCAACNLVAIFVGASAFEYVFKPATTLLISIIAAGAERALDRRYRHLVVAGLLCSLAGDVFLMLPGDWFVPGLASFLVAHLFYLAAFVRGGWRASPWPAVACGAYVMVLLWWLLPKAGDVRVPVAVYGLTIMTMAWQALERWRALRTTAAALAAAGAVLFVASDSALALNRFAWPFALSPLAVMGTYVPAQWMIALSVAGSQTVQHEG